MSLTAAFLTSLCGSVGIVGLGLVTGILTSRLLGPEGRGELLLMLFLPVAASRVGNCGLTQGIAYRSNQPGTSREPVSAAGVALAACLGVAQAAALAPLTRVFLPGTAGHLLGPAVACLAYLPLTFLWYALLGTHLARGDYARYNLYQFFPVALYTGLLLGLWALDRESAVAFAFANVGAWGGAVLAKAAAYVRLVSRAAICHRDIAALFRQGLRLHVPEMAGLLLLQVDQFLLVRMVGAKALGLYAVARAVGSGQAAAANPIALVCFRASMEGEPRQALATLMRQFRIFQLLFLLIAAASIAVTPALIKLAFGRQFAGSAPAAAVLILQMAVWSCAQVLENGLRGLGYPQAGTISNAAGLLVAMLAARPLVSGAGILGMALTMLLAQSAQLAAILVFANRRLKAPLSELWGFRRQTVLDTIQAARSALKLIAARRVWSASASI